MDIAKISFWLLVEVFFSMFFFSLYHLVYHSEWILQFVSTDLKNEDKRAHPAKTLVADMTHMREKRLVR